MHLASGQMREGIGDLREKHEDKAIAPGWWGNQEVAKANREN